MYMHDLTDVFILCVNFTLNKLALNQICTVWLVIQPCSFLHMIKWWNTSTVLCTVTSNRPRSVVTKTGINIPRVLADICNKQLLTVKSAFPWHANHACLVFKQNTSKVQMLLSTLLLRLQMGMPRGFCHRWYTVVRVHPLYWGMQPSCWTRHDWQDEMRLRDAVIALHPQ